MRIGLKIFVGYEYCLMLTGLEEREEEQVVPLLSAWHRPTCINDLYYSAIASLVMVN